MKQRNISTRPLSWPNTVSTKEWIVVCILSSLVFLLLFMLSTVLFPLIEGKDLSSISLSLIQGIGVGGMMFWTTMYAGAIYLRGKNDVARLKRTRVSKSLGAIAITPAHCWTPNSLNLSSDVVLVLTRNTFAVYGKQPFVKEFECPLSSIVGTATRQNKSTVPPNSIEITLKEDSETFVGRFYGLQETDSEEWAYKIAALR